MSTPQRPQLGLVEDSEVDVAAFKRVVERESPGLTVRHWPTGEALAADLGALAPGDPWPAAFVVDLNLPGVDGAELVQQLRSNPATRTLPAFVLSGSESTADMDRCYAAGANAFLTKPGRSAELRALLGLLLASIPAFRADQAAAGTAAAEVDQAAIDDERARYEEELVRQRDEERRGRQRAEALHRLAARLADARDPVQIETILIAAVDARAALEHVRIEPASGPAPQREALFLPELGGSGTVAQLPLIGDGGRVHGVLHALLAGELDDDEEAFLHGAVSLASQALARAARASASALGVGDAATDLPATRWWQEAFAGEAERCGKEGVPLCIVTVEIDLAAVAAEHGYVAADAFLIDVVDRWREAGHDLLSPLGTEVLVALLPGRTEHTARGIAAKVVAQLDDASAVRCAVGRWDGAETGDALLVRTREAALRHR